MIPMLHPMTDMVLQEVMEEKWEVHTTWDPQDMEVNLTKPLLPLTEVVSLPTAVLPLTVELKLLTEVVMQVTEELRLQDTEVCPNTRRNKGQTTNRDLRIA